MLSSRKQAILKSIVEQYINRAIPIPSQQIVKEYEVAVSSATVRNEMAFLEHEGYILRPHTSAGSIPSDKGYRYYVETLNDPAMPVSERFLIDHLFHQVEDELENWLSLAATMLSRMTQNVAVVSLPRTADARFKHVELVSIQNSMGLIVFVLDGAKVKQQLINFTSPVDQAQLTSISNKLNQVYNGLNREQITNAKLELTTVEKAISDYLVHMMQMEDEKNSDVAYLEGWHFLLNQPEFEQTRQVMALMELAEHRDLLRAISPLGMPDHGVQVVIGKENLAEAIQSYSIIIGRYGLPGEAMGTLGIVGPTRMQYARNLSVVNYLAAVLSELIAELYGKKANPKNDEAEAN